LIKISERTREGLEAQKHWRRLHGFELIQKVVTRRPFLSMAKNIAFIPFMALQI
jgi:hypothetical protein